MDGPKTLLIHEDPKKNKDFSFDYSFWSHDEFEDVDGIVNYLYNLSILPIYFSSLSRHLKNTLTKDMFTTPLVNKFWIMPGMGTF